MSEKLEHQIALCISQRKNLEAIFNCVTDGILAIDLEARVVNMNLAAQEITGFSKEDAVGLLCSQVLRRSNKAQCALSQVISGGQMLQESELEIVRPDGAIRTLLVTSHALHDDKERKQGIVAIFKDQTQLRALQTALSGLKGYERLIGKNHRMREIYQLLMTLAIAMLRC